MKRWGLLLSVLVVAPWVSADEQRSLDEAITRALAHSPEVAMAHARVSYAESQARAARWGWFHPEVRVYAGENAVNGANRAGIQVSQDVMRLLTLNRAEVRQATHELFIAQQELTLAQQRLIQQVCESLARVQAMEEAMRVKAPAVTQRDTLLTLAQAQFDDGSGSLEALLAARQARAQAERELLQTQADLLTARVGLAQLLGDPLPEDPARQ